MLILIALATAVLLSGFALLMVTLCVAAGRTTPTLLRLPQCLSARSGCGA
jgi:hypothetical protein